MITSLADIPAGTSLEFDIVIVGGGAAGITLALELEGSGRRVAVLEGGGREFDPVSQARYEGPLEVGDGMEYFPLDASRLRFLGGTTNHWGGWCRPLEANVFGPRPGVTDLAWPFGRAELDDAYARAQQWVEAGRFVYDAPAVYAEVGAPPIATATDVVRPVMWRFSPPTRFGQRYEADLADSTAEVFLGANCVGLDIDAGRVRAVQVVSDSGVEHRVRAQIVVLAGGAIENVRQLLLAASDVPGLDRSGMLGRGFADHPHATVGYLTVDAADLAEGGRLEISPFLIDTDSTPLAVALTLQDDVLLAEGLPNMAFTLQRVSAEDEQAVPSAGAVRTLWGATRPDGAAVLSIYARSEQRFNPDSLISLVDETDDLGVPRVGLSWQIADDDRTALDIGRRIVFEALLEQGYGPVSSGPLDGRIITGGYHHLGGAMMHVDADRGVVDADLRCHALDNLYVAGSAVFPTYCFSNPTLTIVALAVRLARHLEQRS